MKYVKKAITLDATELTYEEFMFSIEIIKLMKGKDSVDIAPAVAALEYYVAQREIQAKDDKKILSFLKQVANGGKEGV